MLRTVNVSETLNEELEQHARYANLAPEDVINVAIADYLRPRYARRRKTIQRKTSQQKSDVVQDETPEARIARMHASIERIARLLPNLPSLDDSAFNRATFYEERY